MKENNSRVYKWLNEKQQYEETNGKLALLK